MKSFTQHGMTSVFEHTISVAKYSLKMANVLEKFGAKIDRRSLVRGAILHDYFLYDWHHHDGRWHGFTHSDSAARNAAEDFDISPREENIIKSHMWPLTLRHLPRSREAAIVCIADKLCSAKETLFQRGKH